MRITTAKPAFAGAAGRRHPGLHQHGPDKTLFTDTLPTSGTSGSGVMW